MNKSAIIFIKIVFWIGVVLDALSTALFLFPEFMFSTYGLEVASVAPETRFSLYLAAAMMLGWTVLLGWGALKPIERRGLLLLTAFPVVAGLIAAEASVVAMGVVPAGALAGTWVFQGFLLAMFMTAYIVATKQAGISK
ncbi:MAG: hypothetical protein HPY53_08065 [Brevinematales bacterium]|nr:hypothetical protein [Brevinematales bacterium]